MIIPLTIENLTDTSFDFDETLTEPGIYDLIVSTGGVDDARLDNALTITVTVPPATPTLTSVTPSTAVEDAATTYTVVGTNLTDVATFVLIDSAAAETPVTPTGLTDMGFTFAWTAVNPETYALVGRDAGGAESCRLDAAVTITAATPPSISTIISVDPTTCGIGVTVSFTCVGTGLDVVDDVKLIDAMTITASSHFSYDPTHLGFTIIFPIAGVWDIVVYAAGAETGRLVDGLTSRILAVTSVTPSTGLVGTDEDFAVVGEGLATVATVELVQKPPTSITTVEPAQVTAGIDTEITVTGVSLLGVTGGMSVIGSFGYMNEIYVGNFTEHTDTTMRFSVNCSSPGEVLDISLYDSNRELLASVPGAITVV